MLESNLELNESFALEVTGDKSISHRSVLFSALAKGKSRIEGFLEAEDPLNTMHSFSKLGVKYNKVTHGVYEVESKGKHNLHSPSEILDFGNGGTGIRLSAGLLAGLPNMQATLTGDESLRKRPMKRIIDPLTAMGAKIESQNKDDRAPLIIHGKKLKDFVYKSPLSSAQVKSCLMLAAIASDVSLEYIETELSRNHTENMLEFLGGKIIYKTPTHFKIEPPFEFSGSLFRVPGDISSAAFFIVLGLLSKKGKLLIRNIGLNPARVGIINVLQTMGGNIQILNERSECGEKIGDLAVYPSQLKKVEISKDLIPAIIDEIPILTIAGLFSPNGFCIRHAEDLRAKESDRIHSMVSNLRNLGIEVEEYKDGYEFEEVHSIQVNLIQSFMDHRIAMSFLVLKKLLNIDLKIDDESWISTSFPNFHDLLSKVSKS
ncbi:MAG: 3-phosphoshikimate 1-carboxyvinyltransferase [Leptospiraceae bacterium]|nr:3-phosphoshikimate 1-carboxyvinyltransferase [Leptospiraceae bacterium]